MAMGSARREESIIIAEENVENSDNSAVLLEGSKKMPLKDEMVEEGLDEEGDLTITFWKRAKLMPHARYDCTAHPFQRAECEVSFPLGRNAKVCSECYCYVCDKLVAQCKDWVTRSFCHCNAHNKSQYWKGQRDFALTGVLTMFNLELSEIDADMQHGGALLQKFMHDISVEYSNYLSGERISSDFPDSCCGRDLGPGQRDASGFQPLRIVYRYTRVFDLVTTFLNQAEKEIPKAAVVMYLGAAKEIATHKDPALSHQSLDRSASLKQAVPRLMARITMQLQRLLVRHDFPKALLDKLIRFYLSLPLPVHCYSFLNSLNFFPWNHGLLTSVLKGQNVTGQRTLKGKQETLWEMLPVIEARVEQLEARQQYKELIRYLKVVESNDDPGLLNWRVKIPFYLCKTRNLTEAMQALFTVYPHNHVPARHLTPQQFEIYLKIFRTGFAPSGRSLEDSARWTFVGNPLQLTCLLRKTFRLFYNNPSLYKNPKCWKTVIRIFSSSSVLGHHNHLMSITMAEPPQEFQQRMFRDSCSVVEDLLTQTHTNVAFLSEGFDLKSLPKACLIWVTQAVRQMILKEYHHLSCFLDVIMAFGNNMWALKLLFDSLVHHEKAVSSIVRLVVSELNNNKAAIWKLWQRLGPRYVGELLCLFLMSRGRTVPSIGISILNILNENLPTCQWLAKEVAALLQKSMKSFGWTNKQVSTFINVLQTSP